MTENIQANIQAEVLHQQGCFLLYNPELLNVTDAGLLNEQIFQLASNVQPVASGGRGQAWFLELQSLALVLRVYQRGGLVAKFNRQAYFGLTAEQSRSFKEWLLLQKMCQSGLPVPRPVAASVCRWPVPVSPLYHARILVERIAGTKTLDQKLTEAMLMPETWQSIGECIARFHQHNIFHADLNANNILLDQQNKVYLIDFDKGEYREGSETDATWKKENMQRLKRSLFKQQGLHKRYYFDEGCWGYVAIGYQCLNQGIA